RRAAGKRWRRECGTGRAFQRRELGRRGDGAEGELERREAGGGGPTPRTGSVQKGGGARPPGPPGHIISGIAREDNRLRRSCGIGNGGLVGRGLHRTLAAIAALRTNHQKPGPVSNCRRATGRESTTILAFVATFRPMRWRAKFTMPHSASEKTPAMVLR